MSLRLSWQTNFNGLDINLKSIGLAFKYLPLSLQIGECIVVSSDMIASSKPITSYDNFKYVIYLHWQ